MKEIVLDTETTGLSITEGHRIVEIGCIELSNQIPTNRVQYLEWDPKGISSGIYFISSTVNGQKKNKKVTYIK